MKPAVCNTCAVLCLGTQWCPSLCDPKDYRPPGSSVHGDSPGKNSGVGCHSLLQVIFSTQGSNPGLPHCRQILYHLSHQASPRILEQVAYPFSSGSSQPRNPMGLLHCRQILYQLSYHRSPCNLLCPYKVSMKGIHWVQFAAQDPLHWVARNLTPVRGLAELFHHWNLGGVGWNSRVGGCRGSVGRNWVSLWSPESGNPQWWAWYPSGTLDVSGRSEFIPESHRFETSCISSQPTVGSSCSVALLPLAITRLSIRYTAPKCLVEWFTWQGTCQDRFLSACPIKTREISSPCTCTWPWNFLKIY